MYFDKFPIIYYTYDINNQTVVRLVKDITINVRVRKAILESITLYDEYDMTEGDTPEIVAAKVYNSPQYHWVIMLCNQRYDYLTDFPMPYGVFVQYVQDKYGDALYDTHHYVLKGTEYRVTYDPTDPNSPYTFEDVEAVTNYDYEDRLNESKRRIKLISPTLLNNILQQFKTII